MITSKTLFYRLVTVVLLVGLTLGAFPALPARGISLPVCQGIASSNGSQIKLGGREINPSQLLWAAGSQPCGSQEIAFSLTGHTRTLVVSPVPTPTVNGNVLLQAMTYISNTSPSVTNPWLLKIEPGLYDLGDRALVLKPYVYLEGSGQGVTVISSTMAGGDALSAQGTVVAASNTEIRFLSILNNGSNEFNAGLYIPDSAKSVSVYKVTVSATGTTRTYGLHNWGEVTVKDSNLKAKGSGANNALLNYAQAANLQLADSRLTAWNGTQNTALSNYNIASVSGMTAIATGGETATALGNYDAQAVLTATNSSFTATAITVTYGLHNAQFAKAILASNIITASGARENYAAFNQTAGDLWLRDSTVKALGGSGSLNYALSNYSSSPPSDDGTNAYVENSTLDARGTGSTSYAVRSLGLNSGTPAIVMHSRLYGSTATAQNSPVCRFSVNLGTLNALSDACL